MDQMDPFWGCPKGGKAMNTQGFEAFRERKSDPKRAETPKHKEFKGFWQGKTMDFGGFRGRPKIGPKSWGGRNTPPPP